MHAPTPPPSNTHARAPSLLLLLLQMAGSVLDPRSLERLPTAATCMNLLKLPPYPSAAMMQSKLLFALRNAVGFELS